VRDVSGVAYRMAGSLTDIHARELGVECIAEGIENQGQLDQLQALHCRFGQGFFIARPLSSEEVVPFLRGRDGQMVHVLFPVRFNPEDPRQPKSQDN
jgi:predicted signal transduction protein with EAL and GGDEF domain